jgi:hypothetical protein
MQAIEVGKSAKTSTSYKDKAKKTETKPEYNYHESTINDQAIRAQLLRGYELFKVTSPLPLSSPLTEQSSA